MIIVALKSFFFFFKESLNTLVELSFKFIFIVDIKVMELTWDMIEKKYVYNALSESCYLTISNLSRDVNKNRLEIV